MIVGDQACIVLFFCHNQVSIRFCCCSYNLTARLNTREKGSYEYISPGTSQTLKNIGK